MAAKRGQVTTVGAGGSAESFGWTCNHHNFGGQLPINISFAQNSLWLLGVRSPRSDAPLLPGIVLNCCVRRMSADHCLLACLGELFFQLLQTVGAAPVSPSVSESLIRDFQFGRCSVFLDLQTSSCACGHRIGFCCRDVDLRTRACQRRLLRLVLCR